MENVFGIDTMLVMGITDVDDKIIKRAKEVSIGKLYQLCLKWRQ